MPEQRSGGSVGKRSRQGRVDGQARAVEGWETMPRLALSGHDSRCVSGCMVQVREPLLSSFDLEGVAKLIKSGG